MSDTIKDLQERLAKSEARAEVAERATVLESADALAKALDDAGVRLQVSPDSIDRVLVATGEYEGDPQADGLMPYGAQDVKTYGGDAPSLCENCVAREARKWACGHG